MAWAIEPQTPKKKKLVGMGACCSTVELAHQALLVDATNMNAVEYLSGKSAGMHLVHITYCGP